MKPILTLKNPWIGKLNAVTVFATWGCLVSILVLLVYVMVVGEPDNIAVVLVALFGSFFAFAAAHLVLAFLVRCPDCNKMLTAQGFTKPEFGDWSTVVIKWFTGSVVCIHCGARVKTNG